MKKLFSNVSFLLALIISLTGVFAQSVDIAKMPGYVDLEKIKIPSTAESLTEIDLGPGLLQLMNSFSDKNTDDGLDAQLGGLFRIRVKSFNIGEKDYNAILPQVEKLTDQLTKENWLTLIRVKKAEEMTLISSKTDNGKTAGFVILSLKPNESATFINIVGNLDIRQLTSFGVGFSDSTLNAIEDSLKK